MKPDTKLVNAPICEGDGYHANTAPLYQTATFAQPTAMTGGEFDYTRSGNPTRRGLEEQIAALEGGGRSFAYTSGMAALGAVTRLARAGEHVLAGKDLYGGTFRLLDRVLPRQGIEVSWVDTSVVEGVRRALRPTTRLLLVESPTNPLQRIVDLRALAALCRDHGALFAVDNTMLSPYLARPLELGADLVLHSATKHLGGHSDLVAGVVTAREDRVADDLAFFQNAEGNGLAPFDCWLLSRGIKTLGVRLAHQQRSAQRIAEFLARHPAVTRVHFPGLADHPGREVHERQSDGPGSLISFETGSIERSATVVEETALFKISVSFGSVGSLISLPGQMSHASIPAAIRDEWALPRDLVRLSIGIEDADDLLQDLDRALALATADRRPRTKIGAIAR